MKLLDSKLEYSLVLLFTIFITPQSVLGQKGDCKPVECYRMALEELQSDRRQLKNERIQLSRERKQLKDELSYIVEPLNQKIKKIQDENIRLANKEAQWPKGKYCILKSGNCPSGFTPLTGGLRALWMYKGNQRYLTQGTFGDSYIIHHGSKERNPEGNDWHGEINIWACCK